jgi:hypothetical protein
LSKTTVAWEKLEFSPEIALKFEKDIKNIKISY